MKRDHVYEYRIDDKNPAQKTNLTALKNSGTINAPYR